MNRETKAILYSLMDTIFFMAAGVSVYVGTQRGTPLDVLVVFVVGAIAAVMTLFKAVFFEDGL